MMLIKLTILITICQVDLGCKVEHHNQVDHVDQVDQIENSTKLTKLTSACEKRSRPRKRKVLQGKKVPELCQSELSFTLLLPYFIVLSKN